MKKSTKETITVIILVIICCIAPSILNKIFGQEKWFKLTGKDIAGYSLMAGSGVAYGLNQAIVHHHYGKGKQFWDKDISWQNKYKDFPGDQSAAYFGSKSFLAFTTDGQHLTQAISTTFLIGGIGFLTWDMKDELNLIPKKDKWKYVLFKKILLPLLIRTGFFELTFNNL